jgi:GxxExxY protein
LSLELKHRGLVHSTQIPVSVNYKGTKIHGQILDRVVESKVIVELKSAETLLPIHEAQILSYLKSTSLPVGLLINFKEPLVKKGIRRFVRTIQ